MDDAILFAFPWIKSKLGKRNYSKYCSCCNILKTSTRPMQIDNGDRIYHQDSYGIYRWMPQKKWINICSDCFDIALSP